MNNIPIDVTRMDMAFITAEPKPATDNAGNRIAGQQDVNRDGEPLWNVQVIHSMNSDDPNETVSEMVEPTVVRIPGAKPSYPKFTPIRLVGFTARMWNMNGNAGMSYTAKAVEPLVANAKPDTKANSSA